MLTPGQLAANARASFATQSFFNEMRWGYLQKSTFDELVESAVEKMKQDVEASSLPFDEKDQIKIETETRTRSVAKNIARALNI